MSWYSTPVICRRLAKCCCLFLGNISCRGMASRRDMPGSTSMSFRHVLAQSTSLVRLAHATWHPSNASCDANRRRASLAAGYTRTSVPPRSRTRPSGSFWNGAPSSIYISGNQTVSSRSKQTSLGATALLDGTSSLPAASTLIDGPAIRTRRRERARLVPPRRLCPPLLAPLRPRLPAVGLAPRRAPPAPRAAATVEPDAANTSDITRALAAREGAG
mmetsp:Transcript_20849/g.71014  ORF Transcript_20849/g.71014 Transcript_20849/m.71014 type:complete len:217 (-) Transcript_20849:3-653(-)